MATTSFVNREKEMQTFRDNCLRLQNAQPLAQLAPYQLPIIQLNGIGGIGKSRLLKEVERHCRKRGLRAFRVDMSIGAQQLPRRIAAQLPKHGNKISLGNTWIDRTVNATQMLINQNSPVVFLIDSLERATDEEFRRIDQVLSTFLGERKLFFVLASQQPMTFEHNREIGRQLQMIQLHPFSIKACNEYLNNRAHHLGPAVHNLIYQWTGGYPLAINTMLQAIEQKKLDPRKQSDQQSLLTIIRDQVIREGVINNRGQPSMGVSWLESMLSLFAIPRYCRDTSFMQGLVETFEGRYRRNSYLAYTTLPTQINNKYDVFKWEKDKNGFALEASIRHIFLKNLELSQPERYKQINKYLANLYKQFADSTKEIEHVRALLEYLYHSARCEESQDLENIVKTTVQQIISGPADDFSPFREEYLHDTELQETLGKEHNTVKSLICRHLVEIYLQLIAASTSSTESLLYYVEVFTNIIDDPAEDDLSNSDRLNHYIQEVKKESLEFRRRLVTELQNVPQIKHKLEQFPTVLPSLLS